MLEVEIGGGKEGMDARPGRWLESLPGSLDVLRRAAGQCGYHRSSNFARHDLHGVKVTIGGNGKTRLDDIHSQVVKLACHADFFVRGHAATRRLLPITQSSVEYRYVLS